MLSLMPSPPLLMWFKISMIMFIGVKSTFCSRKDRSDLLTVPNPKSKSQYHLLAMPKADVSNFKYHKTNEKHDLPHTN